MSSPASELAHRHITWTDTRWTPAPILKIAATVVAILAIGLLFPSQPVTCASQQMRTTDVCVVNGHDVSYDEMAAGFFRHWWFYIACAVLVIVIGFFWHRLATRPTEDQIEQYRAKMSALRPQATADGIDAGDFDRAVAAEAQYASSRVKRTPATQGPSQT